jgi:hypothetical protein
MPMVQSSFIAAIKGEWANGQERGARFKGSNKDSRQLLAGQACELANGF